MHADEAIQAERFATLLTAGEFQYDPAEFHGPALLIATLPAALVGRRGTLASLDETLLRSVPTVFGLVVVALSYCLAGQFSPGAGLAAAALSAVSPGLVYFSRFYIPEMLLVCFTAWLLWAVVQYCARPSLLLALATGISGGLAFATKETAVLSFLALAAALPLLKPTPRIAHAAAAIASAAVTIAVLFTLMGRQPEALFNAVISPAVYFERVLTGSSHSQPFGYYLSTAVSSGEGWVLLPALAGAAYLWKTSQWIRFWTVYAVTLLVLCSVLRYKTPCTSLPAIHAFLVLAGVVAVSCLPSRAAQVTASAVVLALACQAYRLNYPLVIAASNPWAYAPTTRDVLAISQTVRQFSAEGENRVQIISAENLWPLPWYLRGLSSVEWCRKIPYGFDPAALILVTPLAEADVAEYIYAAPVSGRRHLYRNAFDQTMFLRPGLELRGYKR